MKRVKVLFRVNDEVVVEESGDITLEQIERLKWVIVSEIETDYDTIDVEIIDLGIELGELDVGNTGMYNYKDTYFDVKVGVKLTIDYGSDEFLDAMNNNKIEDYLIFV
jgi:hypothetical protein